MPVLLVLLLFSARIRYVEIPPMGYVNSIAVSPNRLLLINDNQLVFLDRQRPSEVVNTIKPNERPVLLGYDIETSDFWVVGIKHFFRINDFTYSIRPFPVSGAGSIRAVAIGTGYIYWQRDTRIFRFNKRNGIVDNIAAIPEAARWFRLIDAEYLSKYPFLTPYYYQDRHFRRFPVTALAEDGMDLYVGTAGYGIFKYHRLTWEKSHITFAPYASPVRRLLKRPEGLYFIGDFNVSLLEADSDSFVSMTFDNRVDAFMPLSNRIYFSSANRLLSYEGTFIYPIAEPVGSVTAFGQDGADLLYATRDGVFRLNTEAGSPELFGLEDVTTHRILTDSASIYAATEQGLFRFDRAAHSWERMMNLPLLDALRFDNDYYLIALSRQLFILAGDSTRPLPYMNIHCFDADRHYLYLGTGLGLALYDPKRQTYRPAPHLPKDIVLSLALTDDTIWLVTNRSVIKMSLKELR